MLWHLRTSIISELTSLHQICITRIIMAEEQMRNNVVFGKRSSSSRWKTSDTNAQYNIRKKLILFLVVLLPFYGTAAQETSTTCNMVCSYDKAYQMATCEDLQLESVPVECNQASSLSLRDNRITEIEPGCLRGFYFLEDLELSYNRIFKIDDNAFIGAPILTSVKLRYNRLYQVGRYAFNGSGNELKRIYLNVNYIDAIEEGTFQPLPKLEDIDLSWNHIAVLTPDVFRGLKNLKRLFLARNKLIDLPEDVFKELSSLIYLNLARNSLSSINLHLFQTLLNLKQIDLSGNRLVAISNYLSLPNIRIDLRWNNLYYIDSSLPEVLTNFSIEIMYLEGNPWVCNCSLEPFRLICLNASPYCNISDNPICKSPKGLIGNPLKGLNETLCNHSVKPTSTIVNETLCNHSINPTSTAVIEIETKSPDYGPKAIKLLIPIIICALLLLLVRLVVLISKKFVSYPSNMSKQHLDMKSKKELELRICEITPIKCLSQEPPDMPEGPSKSRGGGNENGCTIWCKRNLFNE